MLNSLVNTSIVQEIKNCFQQTIKSMNVDVA